jgi:predicted metal-dependent hydrolase
MTTSVNLENIPIIITRTLTTRRIVIKIAPFSPILVKTPFYSSIKSTLRLLKEKISWIRHHRERMLRIEEEASRANQDITKLDKKTSRSKLIARIYQLAQIHGFQYNRIEVRDQKTLWGSCSAKNNINLNMRLAWLPQEIIDYVILHELMHTRVKNHSQLFWTSLEKFIPNAKMLRRQLRAYRYLHCA